MKTLSRTFWFVVLGAIVMVVVASCCIFPVIPGTDAYAYVEIGKGKQKGLSDDLIYVEWKNKDEFDKALAQVRHHDGKICICVLEEAGGEPYKHKLNNDCHADTDYPCPIPENIRTAKVTISKAADKIANGESAANDPHATYRVRSRDPGDIIKVLNALKSPVP
jgi:hypothetical protein